METRANYALIGIFTLAVLAAGFGFVYWTSGREAGGKRETYSIVFEGSVSGLGTGSTVRFNGLRVGEVTAIGLVPNDPNRVIATVAVDRSTPIKLDTKARLEVQLLSGAASIALAGGSPSSPDLDPIPGEPPPIIFAEKSDFQDILESVRNVARRADEVLTRADKIFAENEQQIASTIANVEKFSRALGDNADGVNRFLAGVGDAAEKIGPLAEQLQTLANNVDALVTTVDRNKVARVVDNVEKFAESLGGVGNDVTAITKNAVSITARIDKATERIDPILQGAEKIGPLVDSLTALSSDISGVVRSIDQRKVASAIDNVDRFATALGTSTPDVQTIVRNASSVSAKLDRAADQIDGLLASARAVLNSADGVLNAPDGKSVVQEIAEAARSFRVLADNLDKRTAEITAGIGKFTGPGLKEIEALAADGRTALGNINRVLRNVEQNPQQFIFGGRPPIPAYNGRR